MPLPHEILLSDPFRKPNCRGRRIEALLESAAKPNRFDEPIVLEAVRLLRSSANKHKHQNETLPWLNMATLHAAKQIHADDKPLRWAIEAFLLTHLSIPQIAATVGLPASVVQTFAAIWYEVRDQAGQLKSIDWLMPHAIRGNWNRSDPPEAALWKYLALSGGPIIVSLLVADHLGLPEPVVPDRASLAAKARLLARLHFVTVDQAAASALIAECDRRFPSESNTDSKKGRLRELQIATLKMAAGIPVGFKRRKAKSSKEQRSVLIRKFIKETRHAGTR